MGASTNEIGQDVLEELVHFHGHLCPGLAMGVLAARIALDEIGPHAQDEEVVAVTETDMCGVDAIQFLTGCTFGKGNLIHEDWGKNAFTFFRRSDGRAIRVSAQPDAMESDEEHAALFALVRSGEASDDERERFGQLHRDRSRRVLAMEPHELFAVEHFMGAPPPRARIHASIRCSRCGENVMATRISEVEGEQVCIPCSAQPSRAATEEASGTRRRNLLDS